MRRHISGIYAVSIGAETDERPTNLYFEHKTMSLFNQVAVSTLQDNKNLAQGFICELDHLGLIVAQGEDSATFLHNQLSNDVEHLQQHEVRLAAYCSAKGRMLASLTYWKMDDQLVLQLDRSIQATLLKRLQMFVLRAKTKLSDGNEKFRSLGLGGANAAALLKNWFPVLPDDSCNKVDSAAESPVGSLLFVGMAFGHPRYQWILPQDLADATLQHVLSAASSLIVCAAQAWRRMDIEAGVPRIIAATQEKFVPQMVNFELIGGVNFKKGCYPGQEVVARSQYLGKLKRRMAIATVAVEDLQAGTEVFNPAEPDQPCGMIVNAEAHPASGFICLVELKLADLEAGQVCVGAANGTALQFLPLPYTVHDVTE